MCLALLLEIYINSFEPYQICAIVIPIYRWGNQIKGKSFVTCSLENNLAAEPGCSSSHCEGTSPSLSGDAYIQSCQGLMPCLLKIKMMQGFGNYVI